MKDTLEAWSAMEHLYHSGAVKLLGISNIYDFSAMQKLWTTVKVKPSIIQNRFDYQHNYFDQETRRFCWENDVIYQSFWTLTASKQQQLLHSKEFQSVAQEYSLESEQLFLRFAMNLGMIPLVGTTKQKHMEDDLKLFKLNIQEKHQLWIMNELGIEQ